MHGAQVVLVICLLFNITGNALFKYLPENDDYVGMFIDSSKTFTGLEETEAPAIKEASSEEDSFFRYSGSLITDNNTLYSGLHDTQYYWSLINGNVDAFRAESALSSEIRSYWFRTLDSRTILSTLANVKYYVQDANLPYGYSLVDTYEVDADGGDQEHQLWENDYALPFGYTYDSYIPRSNYEVMTPLEKQEALLQGCVVEDSDTQGQQAQITNSGVAVPYETKAQEGCDLDGNTIIVTEEDAKLELTFNGLENAEIYLYVTGLNYTGLSPRQLYNNEEWDKLSVYEKNQVNFETKYWEEETSINVEVTSEDTGGGESMVALTYNTPYYTWYSNRSDFMVNLAYSEDAKVSMTLTFPTVGVYSFDSLEVLCQPMDNYEQQVAALSEDTLENVDFHENRAHATNQVTGTISLDSAKYLLLTIPYSIGWSAYVDGEPYELLQANTAFMALYLESGDHEISLVYHTPGMMLGLIISLLSLVVAIVLIVLSRIRCSNNVARLQQAARTQFIYKQPTEPIRSVQVRSQVSRHSRFNNSRTPRKSPKHRKT